MQTPFDISADRKSVGHAIGLHSSLGQSITLPDMQGLKSLVSVKSNERKKLPPLRRESTLSAAAVPLPSISRQLDADPLPSIAAANNGIAQQNNDRSHLNKGDAPASKRQNSISSNTKLGVSKEAGDTTDSSETLPTAAPPAPATALFQTTTSPSMVPYPSRNAQLTASAAVRNLNDENARQRLEERGIRTWPILAVVSMFCCNPVIGLLAAVLTLKAENSYYLGNVLQAQREARAAKLFIFVAIITGLIIISAITIWASIKCAKTSCPGAR